MTMATANGPFKELRIGATQSLEGLYSSLEFLGSVNLLTKGEWRDGQRTIVMHLVRERFTIIPSRGGGIGLLSIQRMAVDRDFPLGKEVCLND